MLTKYLFQIHVQLHCQVLMLTNAFHKICFIGEKIQINDTCSVKRMLNASVNPLTDDTILDWSKLKQIADDILKCI